MESIIQSLGLNNTIIAQIFNFIMLIVVGLILIKILLLPFRYKSSKYNELEQRFQRLEKQFKTKGKDNERGD